MIICYFEMNFIDSTQEIAGLAVSLFLYVRVGRWCAVVGVKRILTESSSSVSSSVMMLTLSANLKFVILGNYSKRLKSFWQLERISTKIAEAFKCHRTIEARRSLIMKRLSLHALPVITVDVHEATSFST